MNVAFGHLDCRIGRLLTRNEGPHGSHRDVGFALGRHAIDEVKTSILMRFEVSAQSVLLGDAVGIGIHAFLDEFADGGAPIEEKLLAALGAFDDLSRQHRQPWQQIVASTLFELLWHPWCPGLPTGFITVDQQILQTMTAHQSSCGIAVGVEVVGQEVGEGILVDLRHFKASGFCRSRMIGLACQRIAESIDGPVALGCIPMKVAFGIDLVGHVDDILCADHFVSTSESGMFHKVGRSGIASLLFGVVDTWNWIEHQFGHGSKCRFWNRNRRQGSIGVIEDRIVERDAEVSCRDGFELDGLASGTSMRDVANLAIGESVVANLKSLADGCRGCSPFATSITIDHA